MKQSQLAFLIHSLWLMVYAIAMIFKAWPICLVTGFFSLMYLIVFVLFSFVEIMAKKREINRENFERSKQAFIDSQKRNREYTFKEALLSAINNISKNSISSKKKKR